MFYFFVKEIRLTKQETLGIEAKTDRLENGSRDRKVERKA